MTSPVAIGSYDEGDVLFLLSECNEGSCDEYVPSASYLLALDRLIAHSATEVARLCAHLGESLLADHGPELVIASVARAGTPVGVLVKRWIAYRHGLDVPHYSFSVARGLVDVNAIVWLCRQYRPHRIQFLDGWTSKGTMQANLNRAAARCQITDLDPAVAVLIDPGRSSRRFATRDDVLLPFACLGATASGLLSATSDASAPGESFHSVVFHAGLRANDRTLRVIDAITTCFEQVGDVHPHETRSREQSADGLGRRHARLLARRHGARLGLVNVGICETTRAFFRRRPTQLIVNPTHPRARLELVLHLARERGVSVTVDLTMPYQAALV